MAPGPAMAHRTTRSPGGSGTPGSAHRRQSGPGAWRSNEAPWEQLQWTSASMRLGCAFFLIFFLCFTSSTAQGGGGSFRIGNL